MAAPVARQVVALLQIGFDDLADEIGRTHCARFDFGSFFFGHDEKSVPCALKKLSLKGKSAGRKMKF